MHDALHGQDAAEPEWIPELARILRQAYGERGTDHARDPRSDRDCDFINGDIERVDGELIVPLVLPHGANPSAAAMFPEDIIDVADGVVELPA